MAAWRRAAEPEEDVRAWEEKADRPRERQQSTVRCSGDFYFCLPGRLDSAVVEYVNNSVMGRLVLIADDHAVIRNLLSSMLVTQGFAVCQASDGAEAVRIAREKGPDLVVLDLAMPVMNGLEAARVLKDKMPRVPLIMFTNTIGPAVEREARSAGISAIFSKGASPSLLIDAVSALLS